MKDPRIVYKERLENMIDLIKTGQYPNCQKISHDLINFGWTLELEDEVFISEVLEAIFDELNSLMTEHEIPEPVTKKLRDILLMKMENLIKAYVENNPEKLYNCLKELRYTVTFNQLYAWQKYPEKELKQFPRRVTYR